VTQVGTPISACLPPCSKVAASRMLAHAPAPKVSQK
jgi:hypothetical protein